MFHLPEWNIVMVYNMTILLAAIFYREQAHTKNNLMSNCWDAVLPRVSEHKA
jgi:hypothetical protein